MKKQEKQAADTCAEADQIQKIKKTKRELALVEAALYVSGRPLTINELCSVLETRSKNKARTTAKRLLEEYANRNTALEIKEKDEKFVLQLKASFTPRVKKLVNRPLLSVGPLKTLSYIAYRQPVSQKRVVDVRGHHAYNHIKALKEMGLVDREKSGRSMILRTTQYFSDYFSLSQDIGAMKRELKHVFIGSPKQEHRQADNK